jgi:hypothetical protein
VFYLSREKKINKSSGSKPLSMKNKRNQQTRAGKKANCP